MRFRQREPLPENSSSPVSRWQPAFHPRPEDWSVRRTRDCPFHSPLRQFRPKAEGLKAGEAQPVLRAQWQKLEIRRCRQWLPARPADVSCLALASRKKLDRCVRGGHAIVFLKRSEAMIQQYYTDISSASGGAEDGSV